MAKNLKIRSYHDFSKLEETCNLQNFLMAHEILNYNRLYDKKGNSPYITSDVVLYSFENKKPILYVGWKDSNIFLFDTKNYEKIYGIYFIPKKRTKDADLIKNSGKTLRIEMDELDLKNYGPAHEESYFHISRKRYNDLNDSQRLLAERIYGVGEDFEKNMEFVQRTACGNNGDRTTVLLLRPDYLQSILKNTKCEYLACMPVLGRPSFGTGFHATTKNCSSGLMKIW